MKIPKIRFIFGRKGLSKKDGKGVVELCVTYDRKRCYLSTGVSCLPYQWNDDARNNMYIKGTRVDMELNDILLTLYQKAYRVIAQMVEADKVDLSAIPTLLRAQSVDMTFLDYIVKRAENKNVVDYTKWSYKAFYNKLAEYGKIKFFSDINEKAIRDFDEWLHAYTWKEESESGGKITRRYTQATIGSYHKNLKNFIADAVVDGYLTENVYITKGIKVEKGKTRIEEFLTEEEVAAIAKAKMPTKSLSDARDLFLLQCYSGMAYVDLMAFDYKSLQNEEIGNIVHGTRHKTGTEFSFVVMEEAKEILKRHRYTMPHLPNQKYNMKLKLIADAAGIDKNITSHMGRRTAGSIWLNSGIPLEVVSRCLGHSSIATTQRAYARILDETIVAAFAKMKKGKN